MRNEDKLQEAKRGIELEELDRAIDDMKWKAKTRSLFGDEKGAAEFLQIAKWLEEYKKLITKKSGTARHTAGA